jgi:hypothetical protein
MIFLGEGLCPTFHLVIIVENGYDKRVGVARRSRLEFRPGLPGEADAGNALICAPAE